MVVAARRASIYTQCEYQQTTHCTLFTEEPRCLRCCCCCCRSVQCSAASAQQITLPKPATLTNAPRPITSTEHHPHRPPAFLARPQALAPLPAADALSHTRPLTDDAPYAHCGPSPTPGARYLCFAGGTGCDTTVPHDPISRQHRQHPSTSPHRAPESLRSPSARL